MMVKNVFDTPSRFYFYLKKILKKFYQNSSLYNNKIFPTKDLMLFEELTADKIAIIDEFGLNSYIFSNEKGSTFSNVKEGIRMVYTDTIIPEAEKYYSNLSEQLGLEEEGLRLTVSFDHIPVMQPDMESKANVLKIKSEALNKIKDSGVNLSEEEQRAILGID